MATGTYQIAGVIPDLFTYKIGDRITFNNTWMAGLTGYSGNSIFFSILLPKTVPASLQLDNHLTSDQYRVNGNHYEVNSTVTAQMAGDCAYISVQLATARTKMVGAAARISGYLSFKVL